MRSIIVALFGVLMFGLYALSPAQAQAQEIVSDSSRYFLTNAHLETVGVIDASTGVYNVNTAYDIDPRPLSGWQDGHAADFVITDPSSGEFVAMINQASYRYSSSKAANQALQELPEPRDTYGWQILEETSIFQATHHHMLSHLDSAYWRAWSGIDKDSMIAQVLWVQEESSIFEIHINVLQENRELITALMSTALGEAISGTMSTQVEISPRPSLLKQTPAAQHGVLQDGMLGWIVGARAGNLEHVCCWHVLAVWGLPQGHSPHFHGNGGDATTCVNNGGHGCIWEWDWWMKNPQSKLGVPKSWWSTNFQNGSNNANNYSATVWFQ